jgi:hypothetical protein
LLITAHQIDWIATLTDPMSLFAPTLSNEYLDFLGSIFRWEFLKGRNAPSQHQK